MFTSSSTRYSYKFKYYYTQFTSYRKCVMCALVFLLFVYFYKLASHNYGEILPELNEQDEYDYIMSKYASLKAMRAEELNKKQQLLNDNVLKIDSAQSSIIIDALAKPNEESYRLLDGYSLVTEFINGMFIYNMDEPIESWWPFECVRTKMKHSINTQVCIHDPKYDKHISAQLKENGLWEPTNVRSFIRQLNEVPDANVMDIGANIGMYSLIAAKLNVRIALFFFRLFCIGSESNFF